MAIEPIAGSPVRIPPGRVAIRLNDAHRSAYRRLYARYGTMLDGLPVLREDRDFDGRAVKVTPAQLQALNDAFARVDAGGRNGPTSPFAGQEAAKTKLFKRLQFLS